MTTPTTIHPQERNAVLQLAFGVYVAPGEQPPAGVALAFSDAQERHAFDNCATLGEMADALLRDRLFYLNSN